MAEKASATKITVSEAGKEIDRRLDQHDKYEFGGPFGVTCIMLGFPVAHSFADVNPFLAEMWAHVCEGASPSLYAWKVYGGNIIFQLFLAWVMPGYRQEGSPRSVVKLQDAHLQLQRSLLIVCHDDHCRRSTTAQTSSD
ncbi:hypothetical protein R3P38DRAFT_3194172 [Favolaschia claudopus]|uniref:Uncharacterized protein n=1 Tax=Favolaschia claudopus TaxID=2862362 RepID=A0AAW0BGK5_9AGAR